MNTGRGRREQQKLTADPGPGADPSAAAAASPREPSSFHIEVAPCITVRCAECGRPWGNEDEGSTTHFHNVEAAREDIAASDWTIIGNRVVCARCTEIAICQLTSHRWSDWHESADPQGHRRARWCYGCSEFQQEPAGGTLPETTGP